MILYEYVVYEVKLGVYIGWLCFLNKLWVVLKSGV